MPSTQTWKVLSSFPGGAQSSTSMDVRVVRVNRNGWNSKKKILRQGTGLEGRVTKADILKYIKNRGNAVPATSVISESVTSKASFTPEKSMVVSEKPAIPVGQDDEIIQMDRVRKMIADHMVMSMQTSPHVTSFVEADVTNLVNWRNKIKKGFKER